VGFARASRSETALGGAPFQADATMRMKMKTPLKAEYLLRKREKKSKKGAK